MNTATTTRVVSTIAGFTAIVAGARRNGFTRALSMAAGGGLLAYGVMGTSSQRRTQRENRKPLSVSSVVTIAKSREELYEKWRDPQILSEVFGSALQISSNGEGCIRESLKVGQREITWTSRLIEENEGSSLVWRTDPGAAIPHELSVELRDAQPAEWGTEVTLEISPLSEGLATRSILRITESIDEAMLTKVLRRFKALVEAGEMPTLSHNPAARHRTLAAA
jgi:uncharacterized membrane protein